MPHSFYWPSLLYHRHSALIPNLHRRKVPTKARKQPLFRFDNSRHALSISSYIKEQRDKELVSQVKVFQTTPPNVMKMSKAFF